MHVSRLRRQRLQDTAWTAWREQFHSRLRIARALEAAAAWRQMRLRHRSWRMWRRFAIRSKQLSACASVVRVRASRRLQRETLARWGGALERRRVLVAMEQRAR